MNPIAKIGFLIKGDYSDTEMYDFMDIVYYNGASYVAKKPTIGNAPVRKNEYWQIFAEGGTLTGTSDISDTTVAFQQAQERVNISTGESTKILFGKIKKWFADLKGTAFSNTVQNLLATTPGLPLDATMGKQLKGEVDAINGNLFDSGWRILNTEWNCRYRVKSGVVYVFINTNLTSMPETERRLLGTIPLQNYGLRTLRYSTIMPTDGARGFLMLDSEGNVFFEVAVPGRWNYGMVLGIAD